MKKLVILLGALFLLSTQAFAISDPLFVETNVTMNNYWEKTNKVNQKVMLVAQKLYTSNKINKRTPIAIKRSPNTINAMTNGYTRQITIYTGLLSCIDNDDELAYILAHEMAHDMDFYGGYLKYIAMNANSKKYELKADTVAIDLMVAAGYNPIAAITMGNKIFAEPIFDWGFTYTHPKGSKRLLTMYKYIVIKYPQYLNSPMTQNVYYKNFEQALSKEIKGINQEYNKRKLKQERAAL